ncbi:hypothetical protein HZP31_11910 [Elizabethkingia anophelis]|uniref:hypothetical protein n=1 Tax=Elizabethkingia anophelis TaxID=1117645 RepID=UPI0020B32455|nr:hypothetical protein [Elizabethkingia anophelis]MCT3756077.1 hypothetical protein [Elizabethkingia anophelis]MCT4266429.1 hypothetical protein [Elizabethkingia anophelis]MCT4270037.1 hypothetical protein [Elizabethkingia anophelis]UTF94734.1 hypothetical protein J2O08_08725 [Elizabethkingia anophelis]
MRNVHYPFKLGEQYERWEFDLEILDEEVIDGCDSYIYLGNLYLFGEKAENVEMIFSMDVLIAVYIKFSPIIFKYLINSKEIVNSYQLDIANNILFYKS